MLSLGKIFEYQNFSVTSKKKDACKYYEFLTQ